MASASFYTANQFMTPKRSPTPGGAGFSGIHSIQLKKQRNFQFRVAAVAATQTSSSLYEVLGIQMGATIQEIKTAYRKLARVTHPDVASSEASDDFIRLHAAYSTLSDPGKRADYDRKLFWGTRTSTRVVSSTQTTRTRNWETDQCW